MCNTQGVCSLAEWVQKCDVQRTICSSSRSRKRQVREDGDWDEMCDDAEAREEYILQEGGPGIRCGINSSLKRDLYRLTQVVWLWVVDWLKVYYRRMGLEARGSAFGHSQSAMCNRTLFWDERFIILCRPST